MKITHVLALGILALAAQAAEARHGHGKARWDEDRQEEDARRGHDPAWQGGGQWRVLAFKTVGEYTDRDVIRVSNSRRYSQLQLCSLNQPIRMLDFSVRFGNGKRQDVSVRNVIRAGDCTRAINLKGDARHIRTIALVYERLPRGNRTPLIRVMGR